MLTTAIATSLLFAAHARWTADSAMALHNRIEQLRAAGEPVLVEDFRPKQIDPKENAKADLEAAFEKLNDESEAWNEAMDRDDAPSLPLNGEWARLLKRIHDENGEALKRLEAARMKPVADAQVEFKTPVITTLLPGLTPARKAAHLVRLEALRQASQGKFGDAMTRLQMMDSLAAYGASHRTLIGHLVGTGIMAMQCSSFQQIALEMQVGEGEPAITPDAVRAQIARLLDQHSLQESLRDSMVGERLSVLDSLISMRGGELGIEGRLVGDQRPVAENTYWIAPWLNDNALLALETLTALKDEADAVDLQAFRTAIEPEWQPFLQKRQSRRYAFVAILVPSIERSAVATYRCMTEREAAATALALRWYALDHGGQLPEKLDALVPKYLPRLPRDYLADNQPLKYRGGESPMLWSVGEDGIDHGGKDVDPELPMTQQRGKTDLVWKLDRIAQ